MVGLFDSGSGGINTVRYIKEHAPDVDLVYLIDRKRAPYGIKTEQELVNITNENINTLRDMGADSVLIACCTASTVHHLLPISAAQISIPIIEAISENAKNSTRTGRIGVIATAHTVNTHVFRSLIPDCEVYEYATQELVGMIDGGLTDSNVKDADAHKIEAILDPVLKNNVDTLILGCTHFPALLRTVERISAPYGVKVIIDSARIGAELLITESRKTDKKIKEP